MDRRFFLAALGFVSTAAAVRAQAPPAPARLQAVLDEASALPSLRTVLVAHGGATIAARGYRGVSVDRPSNIKSASKSIVSALVGIAIDKGILAGTDQPIAPLLEADLPPNADPRLATVTVGNLLSMQAGLGRMSGPNYGRWTASRNWVRSALAAPFDGEPGGGMLYSTASTHLLSAILTRTAGTSTLALARDWFSPLAGFAIAGWDRDPQGIYLGGNQMAMTPRSLLAFGELYRRGGVTPTGERILSQQWIEQSWQRRTSSVFSGDGYGYGWFLRDIAGRPVRYGWGYGGQMLYIVPSLDLTVVMTSEETEPSARSGYRDRLHTLLAGIIATIPLDG